MDLKYLSQNRCKVISNNDFPFWINCLSDLAHINIEMSKPDILRNHCNKNSLKHISYKRSNLKMKLYAKITGTISLYYISIYDIYIGLRSISKINN